jgi:hypothetical protein
MGMGKKGMGKKGMGKKGMGKKGKEGSEGNRGFKQSFDVDGDARLQPAADTDMGYSETIIPPQVRFKVLEDFVPPAGWHGRVKRFDARGTRGRRL